MAGQAGTARKPGRPGPSDPAVPEERDILLRGLETFAELGYDRTSARELARRLGVSHNFIYDRYGSKAAFWRAVVDAALGSQLGRMAPLDPSLDDADTLRQVITDFYRTTQGTPHLGRLCADEFSRDTERLDYLYDRYIEPTLASIVPSIDRLVAAGRMSHVPMDVLFFAVISPVMGLVQTPLAERLGRPRPASRAESDATADRLAELVISGLLGGTRRVQE
ncbi:TetR/AcrR family transcriptional regulator [Streptomyces sp. NPDC006422]|uniref:TetR/AcrR family transcriptional regulator n=1 Tax=unclassified Streptomyces TaxID=2593676 RepID=UPI00339F5BFC